MFSLFIFTCNLEFGDALAAGGVLQGLSVLRVAEDPWGGRAGI